MAMVKKIPASSLYVSKPTHWLISRFHFSFAEYYNPSNTNFGVLRVLNDDLVTPTNGFGTHPHSNMEIFTYIVHGDLTHKDSTGTKETLGRGCVQYMSAGTGIRHSEFNESKFNMLRFLQLWILPGKRGLKPNYGSKRFSYEDRHNKFLHILTSVDKKSETAIGIHQDANIYVSEVDDGKEVSLTLSAGRQAYIVAIEGDVAISTPAGQQALLEPRDAAEIVANESTVVTFSSKTHKATVDNVQSISGSHIIVIEMAKSDAQDDSDDDF
eukprot:Colp12_sorted_trinity150504_noHs@5058